MPFFNGRQSRWLHPTDVNLFEAVVAPSVPMSSRLTRTAAHVRACAVCQHRSSELSQFLVDIGEEGRMSADRALSSDRVLNQRHRIARRLRRSLEPRTTARVLRFPAIARPVFTTVPQAPRWLAAAAIAGLVVGVTVGQFIHVHPPTTVSNTVQTSPSPREEPARTRRLLQTPSPQLLDEVDYMVTTPQIPELTPLDELTPRIREITINPW